MGIYVECMDVWDVWMCGMYGDVCGIEAFRKRFHILISATPGLSSPAFIIWLRPDLIPSLLISQDCVR